MAVEPEFPYGMGPGSVSRTVGIVSEEIERYYQSKDEEPERSDLDEDFWILDDDDVGVLSGAVVALVRDDDHGFAAPAGMDYLTSDPAWTPHTLLV